MQLPVRRVVAVVAAAVLAGAVLLAVLPGDGHRVRDVARPPTDFRTEQATSLSPRPTPSCAEVPSAFAPRTITVAGVTRGARVVAPPRDANGVPGVPPLTTAGKDVFAWDRAQGIRPGDPVGNVLLNAHTWPDGSALGNRLLGGLHGGDRIVVRGDRARLCYRVTERVEVSARRGLARYYDAKGQPQLAIVVCSGRRLGPGVWEKRTIWFASPGA